MDGKIIVVTHKKYDMPADEIYLPICVGAGLPGLSDVFQPDNTGDNISGANKTYCELTAIYWAWKNLNLDQLDYVGVSHYRRHFSLEKKASTLDKAISGRMVENLLDGNLQTTAITTPRRTYPSSIEKHYIHSLKGYEGVHSRDIARLKEAIHACSPEYDEAARQVLMGRGAHMLNMFIMSSENFKAYCAWLFPIIDRVVAMSSDREDQGRYAGALSEFCLDIWLKKSGLQVKELPLLETERLPITKKIMGYIKRKIK